jgi:hypothetical protein
MGVIITRYTDLSRRMARAQAVVFNEKPARALDVI